MKILAQRYGPTQSPLAIHGSSATDLSLQSVQTQIQEAQRIAGGQGSEQDVAEAKIELEVWPSLPAVVTPC